MAYVYRHIRLDTNQPFYIGIGTDGTYKRANEKSRRSEYWKRIISKTEYDVEILFDNVSPEFAKQKEIEFIKLYGRVDTGTGILCNMTDGGDGTFNKVYTPEYRKKLSDKAKERGPQPQLQKIIEYRRTKHVVTEEIRRKISDANKGRKLSQDQVDKLKLRTGTNNPMFGKRNYNFKGYIVALKDGVNIGEFNGVHDCAKKLGVQATKVSACLNGKRKQTGGYKFTRL